MTKLLYAGLSEGALGRVETDRSGVEILHAFAEPDIASTFDESGYLDDDVPLILLTVTGRNPASNQDLDAVCQDLGISLVDDDGCSIDGAEPNNLIRRPEVRAGLEAAGFDHFVGYIPLQNLEPEGTILWRPETWSFHSFAVDVIPSLGGGKI